MSAAGSPTPPSTARDGDPARWWPLGCTPPKPTHTPSPATRHPSAANELDAAQFWPWDEAATKLPSNTAARIPTARAARKDQRTIYLPAHR